MKDLFGSCKTVLRVGGELHLILVCKQIKAWDMHYQDWKIIAKYEAEEMNHLFPEYTPRDTRGFPWYPDPSALYVFQRMA